MAFLCYAWGKRKEKVVLTIEQKEKVLVLASEGAGLALLRGCVGLSASEFRRELRADPDFAAELAEARAHGYDELADTLLDISVNPDCTLTEAKLLHLKHSNIKWLLSKRKPHDYGERMEVVNTGGPDLIRALLNRKKATVIETVPVRPALTENDADNDV